MVFGFGSSAGAEKAETSNDSTVPLKEGDVNPKSRKPTDCICCCLFIASLVTLLCIHRQCFQQAYPFKITLPLDHAGNTCGVGEYKDYPKVYYPAKKMTFSGPLAADVYYSNPENLWGVCTKECPTVYSRRDRPDQCCENNGACTWYSESPAKLYLGQYCIFGTSLIRHAPDQAGVICQTAQRAVEDVQDEAFQSLDNMHNSTQHYLRYINDTIPEARSDPEMKQLLVSMGSQLDKRVTDYKKAIENVAANTTNKQIVQVCKDAVGHQKSTLADFMGDVMNGWVILLTCMGVCLYVGGMYLLIICFFVKPLVWGSVFACIIGFAIGGWLFWDQSIQVADTGLIEAASEEQILAVVCWMCSLLCVVVAYVWRRSLQLAVAISSATSSFLLKNAGILFMPQLLALVQVAFLIYWLVGLSGILSTAQILPADNLTQERNRYVLDGALKAKVVFHFFVGFWVHGYLEALGTVATSITVADWYYKPKVNGKKPSSHLSFFTGLAKAIVFHSGSIAFGSLVLAVVRTLRVILELYQQLAKQMFGNDTAKCLLACCRCCLGFLTSTLKFIEFNAYIMVGVTGKSFRSSAWEAWGVVTRNPKRFGIFHGVMWTVNAIGRLFIVGFSLLWGALLLNKNLFPSLSESVHSPWPVLISIFAVSFFLAGLIFGVYTSAGAALFYCFVADEEICAQLGRDAGSYAPGGLGSLLDAEAKRRRSSDKSEDADVRAADEEAPKDKGEGAGAAYEP